jgi:hypothetical protein
MPVVTSANGAALSGVCGVAEAETLHIWLLDHPTARIDLTDCQHVHTAVLQVLLALRPAIVGQPDDPGLAGWLMPLLADAADDQPPAAAA